MRSPDAADTPLGAFCRVLDQHGSLYDVNKSFCRRARPRRGVGRVPRAVPAGVNRRVARAHSRIARIHKAAADMIVPFDRFADMMTVCRRLCAERALDLARLGHISDGNVHPNVIPQRFDDMNMAAPRSSRSGAR